MKRLFIIITLIVSSFFLFSINEVKADVVTYSIDETELDLLNSEDFNILREEAIKNLEIKNYDYYIIWYSSSRYWVYLFTPTNSLTLSRNLTDGNFEISGFGSAAYYSMSNGTFYDYGSLSSTTKIKMNINGTTISYVKFLDTNYELFYQYSFDWNIKYKNFTYNSLSGNAFPSLYEINKIVSEDVTVDKFTEEKEIMNNFYSTIITKIGDLATSFASNYIFILILGIFILIFVFELIRRRLL